MTALPLPRPRPGRDPDPDPHPDRRRPTPRLAVVAAPGRTRVVWVVGALAVLVAAVLAAVTLNAVAADDAVVAADLEQRMRAAETAHGELVTRVAALESPARIAAAAAELGLVRVEHPRQLHVERLVPGDGIVHRDGPVREGRDDLKPLLAQD